MYTDLLSSSESYSYDYIGFMSFLGVCTLFCCCYITIQLCKYEDNSTKLTGELGLAEPTE